MKFDIILDMVPINDREKSFGTLQVCSLSPIPHYLLFIYLFIYFLFFYLFI